MSGYPLLQLYALINMDHLKVTQWNCNGLHLHFNDLQMLINEYQPDIIYLQEMHLKPTDNITLKHFEYQRFDSGASLVEASLYLYQPIFPSVKLIYKLALKTLL